MVTGAFGSPKTGESPIRLSVSIVGAGANVPSFAGGTTVGAAVPAELMVKFPNEVPNVLAEYTKEPPKIRAATKMDNGKILLEALPPLECEWECMCSSLIPKFLQKNCNMLGKKTKQRLKAHDNESPLFRGGTRINKHSTLIAFSLCCDASPPG